MRAKKSLSSTTLFPIPQCFRGQGPFRVLHLRKLPYLDHASLTTGRLEPYPKRHRNIVRNAVRCKHSVVARLGVKLCAPFAAQVDAGSNVKAGAIHGVRSQNLIANHRSIKEPEWTDKRSKTRGGCRELIFAAIQAAATRNINVDLVFCSEGAPPDPA